MNREFYLDLAQYESRTYSQNGEDGIIAKLVQELGIGNKYFVQIGCLGPSNVALLHEQGWQGLKIDKVPMTHAHQELITAENINTIFAKYKVQRKFGLLDIDIDGNDYWIWKALSLNYKPEIVVIEYNAALGCDDSKVIPYDPNYNWDKTDWFGASLKALTYLGRTKGYELAYCDKAGVNAFFVRQCGIESLSDSDLDEWLCMVYRPVGYGPHRHREGPWYYLEGKTEQSTGNRRDT